MATGTAPGWPPVCGDTKHPRSPLHTRLCGVWGASGCRARSGAGARRPALSPRCPAPVPSVSQSRPSRVPPAAFPRLPAVTIPPLPLGPASNPWRGSEVAQSPPCQLCQPWGGGAPGHPLPISLVSSPLFFPPLPIPVPSVLLRCPRGWVRAAAPIPSQPPRGARSLPRSSGGRLRVGPKAPPAPSPKRDPGAACSTLRGGDWDWGFGVGIGVRVGMGG